MRDQIKTIPDVLTPLQTSTKPMRTSYETLIDRNHSRKQAYLMKLNVSLGGSGRNRGEIEVKFERSKNAKKAVFRRTLSFRDFPPVHSDAEKDGDQENAIGETFYLVEKFLAG